jgi:hypothetical protein
MNKFIEFDDCYINIKHLLMIKCDYYLLGLDKYVTSMPNPSMFSRRWRIKIYLRSLKESVIFEEFTDKDEMEKRFNSIISTIKEQHGG